MKIEFNEKELNYMENINQSIKNKEDVPLFINTIGHTYTFEFTCTDIAKANLFAVMMMGSNDDANYFRDTFGIDVKCLNYSAGDRKINELKGYLNQFLNDLDNIK